MLKSDALKIKKITEVWIVREHDSNNIMDVCHLRSTADRLSESSGGMGVAAMVGSSHMLFISTHGSTELTPYLPWLNIKEASEEDMGIQTRNDRFKEARAKAVELGLSSDMLQVLIAGPDGGSISV